MKFRKPGFNFTTIPDQQYLAQSISSFWFGYPDAGVVRDASAKTVALIIGQTWRVEYPTEDTEADTFNLSLITKDATDDVLLQFGKHIASRLDLEILEQPTDSLSAALVVQAVSRNRRLEDIEAAVSVVVEETKVAIRSDMDRIRTELEHVYKAFAARVLKIGKMQTKETLKHYGRSIKEFLKPMLKEGMKVVIKKIECDDTILPWDALLGIMGGYLRHQGIKKPDFLVDLLIKLRDSEKVPVSVNIMWKGDNYETHEPEGYIELMLPSLTTRHLVDELDELIVEAERFTPALQQYKAHCKTIDNIEALTTKVRTALVSEFLREEGSGDLLDFAKAALDKALLEPIEATTVKKK
jgi:hypothetical protein